MTKIITPEYDISRFYLYSSKTLFFYVWVLIRLGYQLHFL